LSAHINEQQMMTDEFFLPINIYKLDDELKI